MSLVSIILILILIIECICLAVFNSHLVQLVYHFVLGEPDLSDDDTEPGQRRSRVFFLLPLCQLGIILIAQLDPMKTILPLHAFYESFFMEVQLFSSIAIFTIWVITAGLMLHFEMRGADSTFSEQERELLEMDIKDRWTLLREHPELQSSVDRALRKKEQLSKDATIKVRAKQQFRKNPAAKQFLGFGIFVALLQLGLLALPTNTESLYSILFIAALCIHAVGIGWIGSKKIVYESAKLSCGNLRFVLQVVISTIRTGGEAKPAFEKLISVYSLLGLSDPFLDELSEVLKEKGLSFDKVLSKVGTAADADLKKLCELTALMHRQGASLREALEDLQKSPSVVEACIEYYRGSALQVNEPDAALLVFLEALRSEMLRGVDLETAFPKVMGFAPEEEKLHAGLQAIEKLLTDPAGAELAVSQLKASAKRNKALGAFVITILYSRYFPQSFPLLLEELIAEIKLASGTAK